MLGVALALLRGARMTTRKLTLHTETLMTLTPAVLERVRGGVDGDIPRFDGPKSDRCAPSQSGPATCPVWPQESRAA